MNRLATLLTGVVAAALLAVAVSAPSVLTTDAPVNGPVAVVADGDAPDPDSDPDRSGPDAGAYGGMTCCFN
jgi:hypothetical protein